MYNKGRWTTVSAYMHASDVPRAPLARAVVRDAIDLSPRVALTSWIFSYSFQPAACPDATNSTDTALNPTNAREYIYVHIQNIHASLNTRVQMCERVRVCVCARYPIQAPTKFLGPPSYCPSPPLSHHPSRYITTLLYSPPRRMHVRAIIITRIPIVNYRSARAFRKTTFSG